MPMETFCESLLMGGGERPLLKRPIWLETFEEEKILSGLSCGSFT